jgi:tRNA/rRNA methyltransferase
VFGNERYGLPNDAVLRCSAVTHIPANPAYASLNLAQAVQLITYEMRLALLEGQPGQSGPGEASDGTPNIGYAGEPATAEQVESMFDHLHAGLVAIGFLDPDNPRKLMPRLRRMFARAGLEREEVNILRGIARRMLMARDGQDTPADGNKES